MERYFYLNLAGFNTKINKKAVRLNIRDKELVFEWMKKNWNKTLTKLEFSQGT